jgi:hypothetical protein
VPDATARPKETLDPMSSISHEGSTNPEHNLTPAEIESLNRLEATAQDGLGAYERVANALAEIRGRRLYRDSHSSFEAYVRERWGVAGGIGRNTPCEALARACEETLSALAADDQVGVEIRLAVHKQGHPRALADEQHLELSEVAEPITDTLVPNLRWRLSQAAGTIGDVAHRLESHAVDVDDGARAQLRDDVLVLDGELAVVKALLLQMIDWDSELERLLGGEFDADTDPEDDE